MFKNFFIIAIRNITRQKAFSAINIFGFAIGLAVCFIITFYVVDDLSYDRFHQNSQDIYRLLTADTSVENLMYGITSGPLVLNLADGVPEVEAATRVTSFGRSDISRDDIELEGNEAEDIRVRTIVADKSFFNVFSFEILNGNSETPLEDLTGIYLVPEKAEQLFPDEDPIGKPVNFLEIENAYVAGIVASPPTSSSIQYDCIVPLRMEWSPIWWDSWTNVALTGYLRLNSDADPDQTKHKIIDYATDNGFAGIWQPHLQKLTDVHLDSGNLRFDTMNWGRSDRAKVITTAVIALLVLIIASINFINLSSARASKRAKEVGMRKIIGSNRKELIFQFLGESVLITYFAAIIAVAIFEITIPYLNDFIHRECSLNLVKDPIINLIVFATVTIIGLLAGLYPAFILSGFKALSVLKGSFRTSKKGVIIRRILVVGQFAVSISLISAVLIVKSQIDYLNRIDLGYDRMNVIDLPRSNPENFETYNQLIRNLPTVKSAGSINSFPGGTLQKYQAFPEGEMNEEGAMFDRIQIDSGLLNVLNITLLHGRNFSSDLDAEGDDKIILNETAVRHAGWQDDPIGKTVRIHYEDGSEIIKSVIGVVKDFNFTTTRRTINPMFLSYSPENFTFLIRTNGIDNPGFLTAAEEIYTELNPDNPFRFEYFDDIFNFQFRQDESFGSFIAIFSIIAIIISSLGLLGLSSYMTEQRTKEIGIRKVLGSSVYQIVKLLSFDFTRWVILANVIAWPLTWFAMGKWLDEFVYKMDINIWIFLLSGISVIIIALLTISIQTIRAANSNPVKALKYE